MQPKPQNTELLIPNIASAIQGTRNPTIVLHNRLEGTPRADNFERAQRCEVRDAAFMIGLAYAHGEHLADDAGSLAFAKVNLDTTRIRNYRAHGISGRPFDDTMPLEPLVERRPIPMVEGGVDVSLDIRLVMGRQWVKMVSSIGSFEAAFAARFPITAASSPEASGPLVGAHAEAWCEVAAVAGRRVDGFKLYQHLRANAQNHAYDGIAVLAPHRAAIAALERPFIDWFHRVFAQPESSQQDAWDASRMEYQFSCVAPWAGGDQVLAADEYYHGRLEWYNVDIDRQASNLPNEPRLARESHDITMTALPAAVSFDGMPNPRLWSFEDRRTNFGEVSPSTTDLAQLLLVQFAISYSNDWHLIPCNIPLGLTRIRGLVATTVFGEQFWIAPAGSRDDESWQKWGLYLLDSKGDRQRAAEAMLVLLPTPPKVQEGRPREEILIVRDEVLNSVWAIEERIALPTGDTKPGLEAARQTLAFHEAALARRLAATPPSPSPPVVPSEEREPKHVADVRYQVMNSVAENWIPFIPVHVEGSDTQIKLQRASMLRILQNDPGTPAKIRPRTSILRHGLDDAAQCAYFIHEEEVPRNGLRLKMSFQRTRWTDGSVWVWLGMRKQSGRGERSSGLAFDQLTPVPPESNR